MALPHLTDEEVRTWTREQKDRWWLENVFRGDMPQLTIRAALTGFLLGGILSATNLYIGAKTGWSLGVGVTSVILAFAIFKGLSATGLMRDITILENNAVQSIATAAGYMTGPLISSLCAYMWITNTTLPWYQILVWNVVAALLGVLVAFPMKRRFINDEQQPFPEGRACGVVLDSLYPHAPQGGTRNAAEAGKPSVGSMVAEAVDEARVQMGLLMAKALFGAAAIAGFIKFIASESIQEFIQGTLLKFKHVWYLPESLVGWYYTLAAKHSLWVPTIAGYDLRRQLAIEPSLDLSMVGAGGLMGPRIASSLLLGCIINYFIIAPIMLHAGEIAPIPETMTSLSKIRGHLLYGWCLWWGISMMIAASLASLFAKPQILISAFTGLFGGKSQSTDVVRHIELPLWVSFMGVPVIVGLSVWMNYAWFGVDPWLGLLAIPLILVLTLIAANATALTSTTPTGALSKITQFTFGGIEVAKAKAAAAATGAAAVALNPATNIIPAGMTSEVASNASNLLMDIKPGYMLGAKPRQQAWGHCIGILSGAIASTPLFFILFLGKRQDGQGVEEAMMEQFPLPGATIWKGVADLIQGLAGAVEGTATTAAETTAHSIAKIGGILPVSAVWAMVIAGIAAILMEIMRGVTKGKFPLSAVAIGLGVVIPPESTFMMFLGAMLFWWLGRVYRKPGTLGHRIFVNAHEPVCAGLIAGWALMGIVDIIVGVFLLPTG